MSSDCCEKTYPLYTQGNVVSCTSVEGASPKGSVWQLIVELPWGEEAHPKSLPLAGQFYMLQAARTNTLLGRPISVFHVNKEAARPQIEFLILIKGQGTVELCSLMAGDKVNLLGPCGNCFLSTKGKVCIIGGGIGVAPVAGFAETLPPQSYDFYASFKSGSYGLQNIKPAKLTITTDDGSVGVHGMLPAALTEQTMREGNYAAVYACGPTPMLAYVKKVAEACDLPCYLSLEAHMACGVGVCLGCTIQTSEGKKRCCTEGPVFYSRILDFENLDGTKTRESVAGIKVQPRREPLTTEPDLSVEIAGVHFKNPVIASSGCFGFGTEYESVFDVSRLGGISSKGLTLEPRQGNDGIRVYETPSGLMNSIGLQNPGIPHFIEHELPAMLKLGPVAIANLSGSSLETYTKGAELLDKTEVPMIELNISCPNVSAGGAAFGMTCQAAGEVVRAVRAVTKKPLAVKLTPQSLELNSVALECIKAGADAISLCNSFQGIAIDIERGVPVFDKLKAGLGGPAVRPIAVRLVYELVQAINTLPADQRVPVIALGGIATWQDAVEFIMAGADAIQVGTATFANPNAMIEIIDGLEAFMKRKGYNKLSDFRGIIQK
ncbi:MAG: dihydroorotate dehydrogenase [Treponema sp.]|nr:dihydroorotate dehydrogenase [Treponema sp.]